MKLRLSSFCGLSRNPEWQEFLKAIAPNLHAELNNFLRTNAGCKGAKDKMLDVYKKIYVLGKGDALEDFIRRRFSYMIEGESTQKAKKIIKHRQVQKKKAELDLNKHKVFRRYQPSLLTFPHKRIIVESNSKLLLDKVRAFLNDKIEIDYIVLEDHAYIEYLLPKYAHMQDKLPIHAKEVTQYKMRQSNAVRDSSK